MKLGLSMGINARAENLETMGGFADNFALHFDGTNDNAIVTDDVFKTFTGGGFSVSYWLQSLPLEYIPCVRYCYANFCNY
mgnify:CR=1 FL=1